MSFGGVLPWAHRMLVVEKRWMTARELNDLLALRRFLPGPNIVNVCARVRRFPGGAPDGRDPGRCRSPSD
jgi:chromate transporter